MNDITLTCVAGINYDYIIADNGRKQETFLLEEREDLKHYLEVEDYFSTCEHTCINPRIVRGKNVFAGRTLNDKEFQRFADCLAVAKGYQEYADYQAKVLGDFI